MDKYAEALNGISNYEIWHDATYDDDGYHNFDDYFEYPFSDSEDIKILSELITKHDNINKGIDELIKKYEDYIDNIHFNMSLTNNMTEEYIEKYDKEISEVWQKHECYKKFIKDLKSLKGE